MGILETVAWMGFGAQVLFDVNYCSMDMIPPEGSG
jgi:hypothetical protein